jgi:uncharacterized lipoprotein YmbA
MEAMKKFTLYLGLNDKDSKVQKISTVEAYKVVSNIIAKRFDGGTIFEAVGIYKHDDGTIVRENTLRIELLFVTKSEVREFVDTLKEVFNQESVAVDESEITSELW